MDRWHLGRPEAGKKGETFRGTEKSPDQDDTQESDGLWVYYPIMDPRPDHCLRPSGVEGLIQASLSFPHAPHAWFLLPKTHEPGQGEEREKDSRVEKNRLASHVKKRALLGLTFCFYDESGFSEKPPIRRTWGKRGQTPIITSTGSWKSLSVTGVIATKEPCRRPRAYFTVKSGAVRADDTIRTLQHLMNCVHGEIALLWDGLPAHRAKAVQSFLRQHKTRFRIIERFPAYAPELNPQEYVWSAAKGKDMANFCPSKDNDLHRQTKKGLKRIQRSESVLRGALKKSGLFV